MRTTATLTLALLALAPLPQAAQEIELADRLERLVEVFLGEQDPGALTVWVDLAGEPLLVKGWGRVGRAGDPGADAGRAYPAGSLTAQLMAVAVLEQADEGRIELSRRVGDYLPELAEDERAVTVAHLLGHASGYPPLSDWSASAGKGDVQLTRSGGLTWLAGAPSYASPGECFLYSDTNTWLLGLILEGVVDMSPRAYFEGRLFERLGLEDTRYDDDSASLYGLSEAGQEIAGSFESDGGAPPLFGSQALYSTAADLARFQRALVDRRAVSDGSYARMTTSGRLPDGTSTHHGYGLSLTPLDDHPCVSFGGGASGARLHVAWYPEFDMTLVLLAQGDAGPLATLERSLARLVLELPQPEVLDLPLTPEELTPYLGDYYMGCSRITILADDDGRLRVSSAEFPERRLLAQGLDVFVAEDDHEVRFLFEVVDGFARAFVLEEQGAQTPAVRMQ